MPSAVPHIPSEAESGFDAAGSDFSLRRKLGFVLGIPLFLLFLWPALTPGLLEPARRLLAVCVLMAFWWITEALPMPVTALLPMVLFPLLGIMPMGEVTRQYGDEILFLFMGGFCLALTMQKWYLHRRIALHIIRVIGTSPNRIILGFMCATAFISMWISNTATTMMMYPIALAVLAQLGEDQTFLSPERTRNFRICMMLGVAYAASIGGMGTLLGTAPNLILVTNVKKLFPGAPEVNFVRWAAFGVPLVLLFTPITWLVLTRIVFRIGPTRSQRSREIIASEIAKLGLTSRAEKLVLLIFLVAALGWVFRVDLDMEAFRIPGWATALGVQERVTDATVAIITALLLFLTPIDWRRGEFLLDWKTAAQLPWGLLIFFGGGLAISAGFKSTGLSVWLGQQLQVAQHLSPLAMILLACTAITLVSEFASNTATAAIFVPIFAASAQAVQLNPLLAMIAVAAAASCGFMLPIATGPNAIVFASGYVRTPDMVKAGIWVDVIGIILVTLVVFLFAIPAFQIDLGIFPEWAR
jgi:sodium-dependent dicarboxylate transporter 2/3/5